MSGTTRGTAVGGGHERAVERSRRAGRRGPQDSGHLVEGAARRQVGDVGLGSDVGEPHVEEAEDLAHVEGRDEGLGVRLGRGAYDMNTYSTYSKRPPRGLYSARIRSIPAVFHTYPRIRRGALDHAGEGARVVDEVDGLGVGHVVGEGLVGGGDAHELEPADMLAAGLEAPGRDVAGRVQRARDGAGPVHEAAAARGRGVAGVAGAA
eukprot:3296483-Prymnesium_polylepis.1